MNKNLAAYSWSSDIGYQPKKYFVQPCLEDWSEGGWGIPLGIPGTTVLHRFYIWVKRKLIATNQSRWIKKKIYEYEHLKIGGGGWKELGQSLVIIK